LGIELREISRQGNNTPRFWELTFVKYPRRLSSTFLYVKRELAITSSGRDLEFLLPREWMSQGKTEECVRELFLRYS
jgi:hypothetical protein